MQKKSAAALILCYVIMLYTGLYYYPRWQHEHGEATISWDVSGYYMYLPALFIYKDIKHCDFKDSILAKYQPTGDFQQAFLHKSGNYVMKYSSGQSILMAPYFFIGHQVAKHSKAYPADGFSFPYQLSIGLGMLLYAFLGLFVLRKVLLVYFKDSTVALTLIALVAGTNYLNYAAIDQAMTHSTLFMMYTLILWASIQFHKKPVMGRAALLGALTGFATLIRPTEIISVILPVLWGVSSIRDARERVQFFFKRPVFILAFGLCFVLIVSVQLFYWKAVSGDWIVYSYQDQGFEWLHPHVTDYMFSYDCGWLRYSPILFFVFIGIIPFIRRKQNIWPVLFFFFINLYIVTAWSIWWYGGRAMVQSYAIAFFPFAAFIESVNNGKRWTRLVFYPIYLLCIYLNIWWTHGAHKGKVQTGNVSEAYYWHTVGRWDADESTKKLLDDPDRFKGNVKDSVSLYSNDFAHDSSANSIAGGIDEASLFIDAGHETTSDYNIPLPPSGYKWVRASADFKAIDKEWDQWRMPQFIICTLYQGKEVKINVLRIHRFLSSGEQRNIFLEMKLPDQPYDQLLIRCWNADSKCKTIIDNLKVTAIK